MMGFTKSRTGQVSPSSFNTDIHPYQSPISADLRHLMISQA